MNDDIRSLMYFTWYLCYGPHRAKKSLVIITSGKKWGIPIGKMNVNWWIVNIFICLDVSWVDVPRSTLGAHVKIAEVAAVPEMFMYLQCSWQVILYRFSFAHMIGLCFFGISSKKAMSPRVKTGYFRLGKHWIDPRMINKSGTGKKTKELTLTAKYLD
jgi:hypothetical protein